MSFTYVGSKTLPQDETFRPLTPKSVALNAMLSIYGTIIELSGKSVNNFTQSLRLPV